MTDQADNTHNPTPADKPLALRLSEGLGPNAILVERLREWATSYESTPQQLLTDAADEIERLMATLRNMVKHWREFGPDHGFDECVERAAGRSGLDAVAVARKPLTDEQIDALAMDGDGLPNSHLELARAVESAHGIGA